MILSQEKAYKESRQKKLDVKLEKTNLLVCRWEFTSSLLCHTGTNGLVTSNSRLTFKLERIWIIHDLSLLWLTYLYVCPRKIRFECYLFVRITIGSLHVAYVGSFKESRQKRLVVKHRKYKLKAAPLQYFIDTTRLYCLYGLLTSNSRLTFKSKSTSLPYLSERNFTQTDDRHIGRLNLPRTYSDRFVPGKQDERIIHGLTDQQLRLDLGCLPVAGESRQKGYTNPVKLERVLTGERSCF